jgi:hypothetical protein
MTRDQGDVVTDTKPQLIYAAAYESVSAALSHLDAIEQLHKEKMIGSFGAVVIGKEDGKPHVLKRLDRPGVRVIPEWFGGDLQTAARLTTDGTVDWFCCPRFDSPSVFASLLDAERSGHFRIAPDRDN